MPAAGPHSLLLEAVSQTLAHCVTWQALCAVPDPADWEELVTAALEQRGSPEEARARIHWERAEDLREEDDGWSRIDVDHWPLALLTEAAVALDAASTTGWAGTTDLLLVLEVPIPQALQASELLREAVTYHRNVVGQILLDEFLRLAAASGLDLHALRIEQIDQYLPREVGGRMIRYAQAALTIGLAAPLDGPEE